MVSLISKLLSPLVTAIMGAVAAVLALEFPQVSQSVCVQVLNSLGVQGHELVKQLNELPVDPEAYYELFPKGGEQ